MTQGVWACVSMRVRGGDTVTERPIVFYLCGSWVTRPITQRLPSQPAVPSPSMFPLCTHPEKSSSSRPTTVKLLLCTVPARERAALSSILPSHMLGVFRKMNCIISWPLVCMSHWKHDRILNCRLFVTYWITCKHIGDNPNLLLWYLLQ